MEGQYCRLEPLDPRRHASELWEAMCADPDENSWTYLPYGPFSGFEEYRLWAEQATASSDPLFFTIRDKASGLACGVASYLRITPASGSIEVGHIHFSPSLRRTPAATEAMYLLMERAFSLGYRRYEWKCDALNAPSRAAALRLGFIFEGIFRQATVYKGRSRDTAWYSIIDLEWPLIREAHLRWLDPTNFDASGEQRVALSELTRTVACPEAP
jgi:RimJ/RimL family protein N-acetyltransferase